MLKQVYFFFFEAHHHRLIQLPSRLTRQATRAIARSFAAAPTPALPVWAFCYSRGYFSSSESLFNSEHKKMVGQGHALDLPYISIKAELNA
jgi:hypothetical protein